MANILLAEDDELQSRLYGTWLKQAGHTVRTAANGIEGLRSAIFECQPDLLITDILMPASDGEELSVMYGLLDDTKPVLVITGCADPKKIAKLRQESNVKAILFKPIDHDSFLKRVEEALASAS